MRVYTAPEIPSRTHFRSVFLAGSIEMGAAEEWQDIFIQIADKEFYGDWAIFNPRRKEWDSSWKQSITDPQFYQQVDWELTWLQRSTHKIFYFAPNTMSPITLMELGKFGSRIASYVICSPEYQRRGNVEVFCHKFQVPMFENLEEVAKEIIKVF